MTQFKCFFCSNPADRVAYYSKTYGSKMGQTIENPTLSCELCYRSPRIINQINPMRGGDEGVYSFTFSNIAKWDNKQLAYHLSKKLWEINHLSTTAWRKLFWRIHFVHQSPKSKDTGIRTTIS